MARAQAVDAIYDLLRAVAARKSPVVAAQDGLPRLLCPHLLGRHKEGRLGAFRYQFGGSSGSGLWLGPEGIGGWLRIAVDKLGYVEFWAGASRTESRSSRQSCVEEIGWDADAQCGDNPQQGQ